MEENTLARKLSHILWIGGSPCSGKSTVSHTIARIYVFVDYHLDAWVHNHFARRIAAGDAKAEAFLKMNMRQRWVERSVEELTAEVIESWTREFDLAIEDLLTLPRENFIVAEGNFFPACVAPYLSSPNQALWLVPTDEFCARNRRARWAELAVRQKRHRVYDEDESMEQRQNNIIARDCQLARYVRQQAEEHALTVHEVDGSLSREELTDLAERHFDPYLIECFKNESKSR